MNENENFDEMKDVYSLTGVKEAIPKVPDENEEDMNENKKIESEIVENDSDKVEEKPQQEEKQTQKTEKVSTPPKPQNLIKQTLTIPNKNKISPQNSQQKRAKTSLISKPKQKQKSTFEPISFSENEEQNTQQNEYETGLKVSDDFVPQIAQNMFINIEDLPPLETSFEQSNECMNYLDDFKKKGKIPPYTVRPRIMQFLQRQKVNALVKLNYKEAQETQETITKLMEVFNEEEIAAYQHEKIEQLEQKLNDTTKRLDDLEYETKDRISKEKYMLSGKRETLERQHEHELDQFEVRWNDETFLKKFAKPSNELNSLRSIERALVAGRDFAGAEETRAKIEMLEHAESEQAQKRAEEAMVREQNRLIEKQIKELNAFEELGKRMISDIEREQEEKKQTLSNRIDNLKQAIKVAKETKNVMLPPVASSPASAPPELAITPRTSKRYNIYKCIPRNPKITVKPLGKTAAIRRKTQEKKMKAHYQNTFL